MKLNQELLPEESLQSRDEKVRVCYYGNPGTAKTTNSAAMARLGKTYFFAYEDYGLKRGPLQRLGIPVDNIIPIRDTVPESIMERFWALAAALRDDPDAFVGVQMDTMTELVSRSIARITRKEWKKAARAAAARGEEYTVSRHFRDVTYWGILNSEVQEVVDHYITLPCHLALTAHIRRDEDEDDGSVAYGPAVNPAVQADINAYVDIIMLTRKVGLYDSGETVFIGSVNDTGKYISKDRFGVLPNHLANPTFDRVLAYVTDQLDEATDPIQQRYLEWRANQTKAISAEENEEQE